MSRIAVMGPQPAFSGKSKIPKLDSTYEIVPTERQRFGLSANPTRLERMRVNYENRLLQEKEEKIVTMYEENQRKALQKAQSASKLGARDFFRQRQNMIENGNTDMIPMLNRTYQRREPQTSGARTVEKPPAPVYKQNKHIPYKKMSAGRDKSNPLAPIERNNTDESEFSIPRKAKLYGRPRTKDSTTQDARPVFNDNGARSAPGTTLRYGSSKENINAGFSDQSPDDDSPPPNLSHLKSKQKVKSQIPYGRPPRGAPAPTKPTDFQKWQMQQDQERTNRLKKNQEANPVKQNGFGGRFEYEDEEDSDEGMMDTEEESSRDAESDIQRKQREIMAKIAAQQAELERIQKARAEEEESERREREKRKRREEERQKRQKKEEERRRKEEFEREKREEEEELARIQRRVKEEQLQEARMRTQPQYEDDYYNDRTSHNSHHREPAPPSKPKPVMVKNNHRVKQQPPPRQVNHSPPPTMDAIDNTSLPPPSNHIKIFEQAAHDPDAYENQNVRLVPCSKCGRSFASDRLQKHMNACDNLTKKRKVMDPTKMRVAGTEMEKYTGKRRPKTPPKKKSNWRAKHESFMQSIQYARKATLAEKNGTLADLPPPPPEENPDYVQCQYCNRKFNPNTAERHIPRCKDIKSRPAPPRRR